MKYLDKPEWAARRNRERAVKLRSGFLAGVVPGSEGTIQLPDGPAELFPVQPGPPHPLEPDYWQWIGDDS